MRLFDNLFWGILFIVAGLVFFLKYYFHIDISAGRTIIAFILIYSGLVVAFGRPGIVSDNNIVFEKGNIRATNAKSEYNVIFSKGMVDLSGITPTQRRQKVEVNAIFASGTVFIGRNTPYSIKVSSVFANASLPDNSHINFGERTYRSRNFREDMPYLEIEANSVFGDLQIIER